MWHIFKPQLLKWMFIPYCIYMALLIYLSVTFNGEFLDNILKKEEEAELDSKDGNKGGDLNYDDIRANVEGKGQILALLVSCFVLWLYFAWVECG